MSTANDIRSEFARLASDLPALDGRGVVVAVAAGHGGLWELCVVGSGQRAATPGAFASLTAALEQGAQAMALRLVVPPRALPGAELGLAPGAQVYPSGALQLQVRGWSPDLGEGALQAVRSIHAVREDSEQSVLALGETLRDVLNTSRDQCAQISKVVDQFQSSGGQPNLSSALQALEGEVTNLGGGLRERLGQQRKDLASAAASASDIIGLAEAVDSIAQSARVLTFNARVESARLGEQGKGFVVIANAIRDLANDVRTSNEVVTRLATRLASVLPELERVGSQLSNETEARLGQLRARLESVRTGFEDARGQTLEGLRASESAAVAIRDKSHVVIQSLQYQDRASQALRHAADQVERIEAAIGLVEEAPEDLLKRVGDLGRQLDGAAEVLEPSSIELF